MNSFRFVFVISPTEYGGQIEHAFDTAVALALDPTVARSILLTRSGAKTYLNDPDWVNLEVKEIIPSRRIRGSGLWNTFRPIFQLFDLAMEHIAIRRQISTCDRSNVLLVLDTSRYPIPQLLSPRKAKARIAIFVHNARPHVADKNRSFRDHVLLFLERCCINRADLALTHGDRQLATVASYTTTKLASVPLPEGSFLDGTADTTHIQEEFTPPYALCIGELRENKGTAIAMGAARTADVLLVVAGKSEDDLMSETLANLAAKHAGTCLMDEFLDKERFDGLILGAQVILLPYTHFDAQSGILAKAMKAKKKIIASDLPSLREQAGAYDRISFVPAGRIRELASSLRVAMSSEQESLDIEGTDPGPEWKLIADTLLANV